MRSMPTSETRTHASMTIPLSRTRSRTSMRLVPPAARSTGIGDSSTHFFLRRGRNRSASGNGSEPALERTDLFLEFLVLSRQHLFAGRKVMIETPPIEPNLLCLVDRTDQQTNADREQLDFRQRNLDIAGDHEALVQHAIEHLDQAGRP